MPKAIFPYLAIFGIALLGSSCVAQTVSQPTATQEMLLKTFLQGVVRGSSYGYLATRYDAVFIDLTDDGMQEVVVYFTDRYSCGIGGCTTLILVPKGSSFDVISKITRVRLPIQVLATKSNGWHDLAVTVRGKGIHPSHVAKVPFNGTTYATNPSVPPATPLKGNWAATTVIPRTREARAGKALFE